jgi:hypothetical protein
MRLGVVAALFLCGVMLARTATATTYAVTPDGSGDRSLNWGGLKVLFAK